MLTSIRPLTQDERQTARLAAYQAVERAIGECPTRDEFSHHATSSYPTSVTRLISGLCLLLLLAAFTPSAIRLYVIGSHTFGQAVDSTTARTAVGIATVLSAEVGQVVFSLALATLGTGRNARRLLYASMGIATAISLVGNVQLALPEHITSPFAWLEAIAPPLLVLSTAYVLKEQLLDAIQQRHANEVAYQSALGDWRKATYEPESHAQWLQFYANTLRDALRKANTRRKETLETLTLQEWRWLITREFQNDHWYEQVESQPSPITLETEPPIPALPMRHKESVYLPKGNGAVPSAEPNS